MTRDCFFHLRRLYFEEEDKVGVKDVLPIVRLLF